METRGLMVYGTQGNALDEVLLQAIHEVLMAKMDFDGRGHERQSDQLESVVAEQGLS